eukprot:jgi/Chrzof1/6785/Cz19g09110.t1
MSDCVGVLKYGLYSVRPALPESRSFQMVLEVPRCFQMFLDVSKCVQKFLEPESHRGPTLKPRPQHRAEDTESLERLRQQISSIHTGPHSYIYFQWLLVTSRPCVCHSPWACSNRHT